MSEQPELLEEFVRSRLIVSKSLSNLQPVQEICSRFVKALKLLPDHEKQIFLSSNRNMSIEIVGDPKVPFGMKTRSTGHSETRKYTVIICRECGGWDENRFLGALLREFGHIITEIPPDHEWPISRGDWARFKEHRELIADSMVWKWGLRHYDMSYLVSTFPSHWVERIVTDIEKLIQSDDRFQ